MFDTLLPIPDAESMPLYRLVLKLVVCVEGVWGGDRALEEGTKRCCRGGRPGSGKQRAQPALAAQPRSEEEIAARASPRRPTLERLAANHAAEAGRGVGLGHRHGQKVVVVIRRGAAPRVREPQDRLRRSSSRLECGLDAFRHGLIERLPNPGPPNPRISTDVLQIGHLDLTRSHRTAKIPTVHSPRAFAEEYLLERWASQYLPFKKIHFRAFTIALPYSAGIIAFFVSLCHWCQRKIVFIIRNFPIPRVWQAQNGYGVCCPLLISCFNSFCYLVIEPSPIAETKKILRDIINIPLRGK